MKSNVEELAYKNTLLGELTLRRRTETLLQNKDVYEVKLGDEYLMSSLFTESERKLAELGLSGLGGSLDVVIGGLGLGYTAAAALANPAVERVLVIDLFQEVIEWHRDSLVPLGHEISTDQRCELRQGDFFALALTGLDELNPGRKFDSVLLDIDHSPEHFLNDSNSSFYTAEGFGAIKRQLKDGGTFALWSNDDVDEAIASRLRSVFGYAAAHKVEFPNPYTNATSVNSVYVARLATT